MISQLNRAVVGRECDNPPVQMSGILDYRRMPAMKSAQDDFGAEPQGTS